MSEELVPLDPSNSCYRDGVSVAAATLDMVDDLVSVHCVAFRGAMSSRLGREYLRAFFSWFINDDESIAVAALIGDEVAGYAVGAPLGYQRGLNKALVRIVLKSLSRRPWLMTARDIQRQLWRRILSSIGNSIEASVESLPDRSFSLVGIGTSPEHQGRGIGKLLLLAFENEGIRLGARAMRLSVQSDNDVARQMYSQLGWHPVEPEQTGFLYYMKIVDSAVREPIGEKLE